MTPRERLLRAISFQSVDHVPLAFLQFEALQQQCASDEEFILRQIDLGLDPLVWLPNFTWGKDPGVRGRSWTEPGQLHPTLHKTFITPLGELNAAVPLTEDWPYGQDIPLMSDFGLARQTLFPVRTWDDLDILQWMLQPPDAAQVEAFHQACRPLLALAEKHQLAVRAGFTRLADTVGWLCGGEQIGMLAIEQPDMFRRLLQIISDWHLAGMKTVMQARPHIYVQGEWYATPFLSPALFDEFYAPVYQKYIDLAHAGGAKFCYLGTANMMPFLPSLNRLGVDVIYGIDPLQGGWDFNLARQALGHSVALWGGVNAYLQVVDGGQQDVETATLHALQTLSPGGGFILSPVDDTKIWDQGVGIYADWNKVERNVRHMVEVWRKFK